MATDYEKSSGSMPPESTPESAPEGGEGATTVELDTTDVADDLADCEVGDKKIITFEITAKEPGMISGKATAVEYASEEENEETPPEREMAGAKKMPKAVMRASKMMAEGAD